MTNATGWSVLIQILALQKKHFCFFRQYLFVHWTKLSSLGLQISTRTSEAFKRGRRGRGVVLELISHSTFTKIRRFTMITINIKHMLIVQRRSAWQRRNRKSWSCQIQPSSLSPRQGCSKFHWRQYIFIWKPNWPPVRINPEIYIVYMVYSSWQKNKLRSPPIFESDVFFPAPPIDTVKVIVTFSNTPHTLSF